jgi:hypothetical protein
MSIHNKLYNLSVYQIEPIARQYNLEANKGLIEDLNRSFPNVESAGVLSRDIHQWMANRVPKQSNPPDNVSEAVKVAPKTKTSRKRTKAQTKSTVVKEG